MSSNIKINPIPIEDVFKLPIYYTSKKEELKNHIISDLELINLIPPSENDKTHKKEPENPEKPEKPENPEKNENNDKNQNKSMYDHAFQPKTEFGSSILKESAKYYSHDVDFLKDTQLLLKTFSCTSNPVCQENQKNIIDIWREIKYDTGFKEKYHYIDWSYWEFLNQSELFLQFMSMYNMASPVLSLLVPFIILIIPFFIIKAKGLSITMPEYIEVLKVVASNHAVGKLFTQFNSVATDQKIYLLISVAFYFFSIYQNILTCIRFNANMKKIHDYLGKMKIYTESTIQSMNDFLNHSNSLPTYLLFNEKLTENRELLEGFKNKLQQIRGETFSIRNFQQIGHLLKFFYQLHCDKKYNDCFLYAFGFNGYVEILQGLQDNIGKENICFASFDKDISKTKSKTENREKKRDKKGETSNTVFKEAYYPALINKNPVRNTIHLNKSLIITGPNASGKTTTLKTALINIIITQQFGCGFYQSAVMQPFKYIHCYLNIPDTSGRDSLFQAEARRCKEILDIIENSNKTEEKHFCVFDELYSGTNPDEAVISSVAFMKYLLKHSNVTSILTTHFVKVCKKLDTHKKIKNHQMEVLPSKNNKEDFTYTYLLKTGISSIRGGLKVLKDMNYPRELFEK